MKGSIIIVSFFIIGVLMGWAGWLPDFLLETDYTQYVLYLLMFLVGLSIGGDNKLREILLRLRFHVLLVPLATIVGTLLGSALISLVLIDLSFTDCMAVGTGFGYYSLSSVFITQYKGAEMGTIALIANIFRELITLLGAPLLVRYFGRLAPICSGGATTMDTTLPIITRYSGKDLVFVAVIHGFVVDFTVPFFVTFFCTV
ncbi:MAG: lysine exporter LysO family protein [Parabacteroides sp.]|nr:lysine exporter LysO family protein [Parabacteroides sp.]MBP8760638.1 lysine exporter LysO family protein [Parabacteroides sp.]MBP9482154.1 lysine exporter LysO family protein [Parabacteroides sp.]MBP9578860.1 lysine exporter LysO family protein [Parabacteroides sp.]MDD3357535.1 lysine exporter LysO family protein [Parabacteroides sp.]